jgi:hypothetical protein
MRATRLPGHLRLIVLISPPFLAAGRISGVLVAMRRIFDPEQRMATGKSERLV